MVPENRTSHIIPTETLIEFLKCSAGMGVKAIGFLGDGEPTLHPGVYDAVEAGAAFGLDMAIATNGVALNAERLPKFLASLNWIRFTLAVGERQAYKRVMGGNEKTFDKVVNNIRRCVEIKKELGLPVVIGSIDGIVVSVGPGLILSLAKSGQLKSLRARYPGL